MLDAGKLAYSVEFNTDVLDAKDKNNIDFSRFSSSNYILPDHYPLMLRLNDRDLSDFTVPFYPREEKKNSSEAYLLPELIRQL
ncbi:FimD/PapC N-terminal domain-containing protein [Serratia symbiotica]|nr:FimD/PapC N-terminal domain-containing protein [Serratia symbiotica]